MITIEELKAQQLQARKYRNSIKAALLTTLLGELDTESKRSGKDADVAAFVKKFMKNVAENMEIARERRDSNWLLVLQTEFDILESYLPKQLNRTELTAILATAILKQSLNNKGSVMKYLKDNFAGQYDGKLASEVVTDLLGK